MAKELFEWQKIQEKWLIVDPIGDIKLDDILTFQEIPGRVTRQVSKEEFWDWWKNSPVVLPQDRNEILNDPTATFWEISFD